VAELRRIAALTGADGAPLACAADGIEMTAVTGLAKVKLQVRPRAHMDRARLAAAVGVAVPGGPAEPTGDQDPCIYWCAPGEWLMVSADRSAAQLAAPLAQVLRGTTCAITDLSDGLAVIDLAGRRVSEVLAEGCGIDLEALSAGRYALTQILRLPIIVHRRPQRVCFRVFIDRSVARHLWEWLRDGAR
jgi:sarcosine oxidase subunit gamma